jgi:hypothetical protein
MYARRKAEDIRNMTPQQGYERIIRASLARWPAHILAERQRQ